MTRLTDAQLLALRDGCNTENMRNRIHEFYSGNALFHPEVMHHSGLRDTIRALADEVIASRSRIAELEAALFALSDQADHCITGYQIGKVNIKGVECVEPAWADVYPDAKAHWHRIVRTLYAAIMTEAAGVANEYARQRLKVFVNYEVGDPALRDVGAAKEIATALLAKVKEMSDEPR